MLTGAFVVVVMVSALAGAWIGWGLRIACGQYATRGEAEIGALRLMEDAGGDTVEGCAAESGR